MSLNSGISRGLISSFLILALSMLTFGDTLHLKAGGIIKGKIVGFGNGKFTVAIGEGSKRRELTCMASEVESIQFDSPEAYPQTTTATNQTASYKEPVP